MMLIRNRATLMRSKKADIPVTILVMLTIALCMFTLVSFYLSNKRTESNLNDYPLLKKIYFDFDNSGFLKQAWPNNQYSETQRSGFLFLKKTMKYQVNYLP